ncbi:hypothetical protein [Pseudomonas sp. Z3-8]|uniref:hypothetical protein n=1 Tax=Pseudomonas sp. Z3-8 TaxID=2817412 RepID=UPI003DA7FC2E
MPDILSSVLTEQQLTDIRSEICFDHQPPLLQKDYKYDVGDKLTADLLTQRPGANRPTAAANDYSLAGAKASA